MQKIENSTELLHEMEKRRRDAFYAWLAFVVYLIVARMLHLKSSLDDILEWRLWVLFGGWLLFERWAIRVIKIVVAAIKETANGQRSEK